MTRMEPHVYMEYKGMLVTYHSFTLTVNSILEDNIIMEDDEFFYRLVSIVCLPVTRTVQVGITKHSTNDSYRTMTMTCYGTDTGMYYQSEYGRIEIATDEPLGIIVRDLFKTCTKFFVDNRKEFNCRPDIMDM
jgi:hypothetical protein